MSRMGEKERERGEREKGGGGECRSGSRGMRGNDIVTIAVVNIVIA